MDSALRLEPFRQRWKRKTSHWSLGLMDLRLGSDFSWHGPKYGERSKALQAWHSPRYTDPTSFAVTTPWGTWTASTKPSTSRRAVACIWPRRKGSEYGEWRSWLHSTCYDVTPAKPRVPIKHWPRQLYCCHGWFSVWLTMIVFIVLRIFLIWLTPIPCHWVTTLSHCNGIQGRCLQEGGWCTFLFVCDRACVYLIVQYLTI